MINSVECLCEIQIDYVSLYALVQQLAIFINHAAVAMMSTFLLEIQTESGEVEWRHDRLVCCKCNA